MAYAQKNYSQIQGISGKYTIKAIGCFLTAFCNLEDSWGRGIDPPALNDWFVQHGTYIDVDDNILDDLDWDKICAYDSLATVTQSVNHGRARDAGWPNSNDAIVRFYYQSVQSGQMIFHFCKVADWQNHLILDSWDGMVKQSPYGEPTAWATYEQHAPVAVTAPPAQPAPKAIYERLATPLQVRTKYDASLWELSFSDYADAEAHHKIATVPAHTEFTAVGKATRADLADRPVYFMSAESFAQADVTGQPAYNQGVNTIDLEPAPAPTPAPVEQAVATPAVEQVGGKGASDVIEVKVLPPNPEAWKGSFKTNDSGDYIAEASVVVHDLDGKEDDIQLVKGQTVHVAGKFTGPDGIEYYRTVNATNGWIDEQGVKHAPNWRGIPLASLKEDDAIFTIKDDLIDDFKEMKGYIGTRQKAIITAAKIHGEVNWLADRLKKKGSK